MKRLLTDQIVRGIPAPKTGMTIVRDQKVRGFGVRALPSGTKAFILDYSAHGRRHIWTIGKFGEKQWNTSGARAKAEELKAAIRYNSANPARDISDARHALRVVDLCERFKERRFPKLRPTTLADYERMLAPDAPVLQKLGNLQVAAVRKMDISDLHDWISKGKHNPNAKGEPQPAPVSANLYVALCSSLFNFAVEEELIDRNPAKGVKRNPVQPRARYLTEAEIEALTKALKAFPDQNIADLFRLLLLTGARRGETRAATWDQFDRIDGYWTKWAATTKQRREHRVWLTPPVRLIIEKRRQWTAAEAKRVNAELANAEGEERQALLDWRDRVEKFVFPAREGETGHVIDLKKPWNALCAKAKLPRSGPNVVRVHDLRHSYAATLASGGTSLQLIGALLGHSQIATTQRYAHLTDAAQRDAAERAAAAISGASKAGRASGRVIPLKSKR